jgi:hypothetical protein
MIVSRKIAGMFKEPGFVNIDYLIENKLERNPSKILGILNRDWRKWIKPFHGGDIDPTFGYTTKGANRDDLGWNSKWGCQFLAPETGTLTDITVEIHPDVANQTIVTAVYSDSANTPNALLVTVTRTDIPTTDAWYTFSGFSLPITADTFYWLALNVGNAYTWTWYDTLSNRARRGANGADSPPPSDPFGAGTDYTDRRYSIYATYTKVAKPKGTIVIHAKLAGVI